MLTNKTLTNINKKIFMMIQIHQEQFMQMDQLFEKIDQHLLE